MNSRDAGDATRQAQHILLAIPSLFVTGVTFSQRDGVALSGASLFGQRSALTLWAIPPSPSLAFYTLGVALLSELFFLCCFSF